jgi:putative spermidine/putrescine transport system substrate-binding protein
MSVNTLRRGWRRGLPVAMAATASLAIAACGGSSSSSGNSSSSASGASTGSSTSASSGSSSGSASASWNTAQSAAAGGGMAKLVAAAKQEGTLNVIALPPTWANYGELLSTFSKKYGIKITSANPNGSSQDEINAVKQLGTQSRAPDVLDVGQAYALAGTQYFAPYKVASWSNIPAINKDANGDWYNDYGGYISIGCNTKLVKVCPTSFKQLLDPMYKGQVALDGDPTEANAAFSGVYAAALSNGGSLSNINPGLSFFKQLVSEGNFNKTQATQATITNGQTPIVIDWDYLNAAAAQAVKGRFKFTVAVPQDATYAAFYAQAINKNAPHPAAARLWEEFLYSPQGQNLWLKGLSRPVELPALEKSGQANKKYVSELPKANPNVQYPTTKQTDAAEQVVAQQWGSVS